MKTIALIVAAGNSVRFGGPVPKQFQEVAGRPLLAWTISRFEAASLIDEIVLVVADEQLIYTSEKIIDPYKFSKVTKIVPGGRSRQESVLNGLERLPLSTKLVAIHDGARALVAPGDIDAVVKVAAIDQAALLATPVADTVKRATDSFVMATIDRSDLFLAQTPQVFGYDLILKAHREAAENGLVVTDDAGLIEKGGFKVRIVEPKELNIKVTSREDLLIVETILSRGDNE